METGVGSIRELVEDYPDVLEEMLELLADRSRKRMLDDAKRAAGL